MNTPARARAQIGRPCHSTFRAHNANPREDDHVLLFTVLLVFDGASWQNGPSLCKTRAMPGVWIATHRQSAGRPVVCLWLRWLVS
jgi:hypothetical protein